MGTSILYIIIFWFQGTGNWNSWEFYSHSEQIVKLMTGIFLITSDYLHTNDATYLPKCILWMFLPDGGPHLMREDQVPRLTSWLFSFLSQEKMEGRKLPNGFSWRFKRQSAVTVSLLQQSKRHALLSTSHNCFSIIKIYVFKIQWEWFLCMFQVLLFYFLFSVLITTVYFMLQTTSYIWLAVKISVRWLVRSYCILEYKWRQM